jgi:phospholipase/carboxylesterase
MPMISSDTSLDSIEIATRGRVELAVIWLHGLGADGNDFVPIVEELRLPFGARFVFPHAPVRPVTINGGVRMRAWYDLLGFGDRVPEDADGIRASAAAVSRLIGREIERGLRVERIVLAGFSQGGAIALQVGLREPQRLAGVLALSTYLPLASTLAGERATANADVPLFVGHGTDDPIVPLALAERSKHALEALGYRLDWRLYAMGHSVCATEIRDINDWLAGLPRRPAG